MVPKAAGDKLEFHIKLLAGNNVVMIEANGYESEIFTPHVSNGRIGFQNIIPKRRCCPSTSIAKQSTKIKKSPSVGIDSMTQTEHKPVLISSNSKAWRLNAGTDARYIVPRAFSTPTSNGPGKENYSHDHHTHSSHNSTLPTPELPRRIPPPQEVAYQSILRIPSNIKISRMYRHPTPSTPNHVGRVIGHVKSGLRTAQLANTSKMTPSSSPLRCYSPSDGSPSRMFPSLHACHKNMVLHTPSPSRVRRPNTPGTVTKWRKCITPVRTYSRNQIQKRSSIASVKKIRSKFSNTDRHGKVLPTYMVNPTQGTRPNLKIEVKKRKIIIDRKTAISPHSFKQQQNKTHDLKANSSYNLPKNRKEYEAIKHSAFDLLTNSSRSRCMSSKLNAQFRKGCVNKVSSTCPNYKMLCTISSLDKPNGEQQQKKQLTIKSEAAGSNNKNNADKQHVTTTTKHNS